MSYFLILNPGSGGGESKSYFSRILQIFNRAGVNYNYEQTEELEDAYQLSRQANRAGYEVVVAVGGDGTINRVINGFYDGAGQRLSSAKLGVIHTGTSPDFCKSYGLPLKVEAAARLILTGTSKRIPMGQIQLKEEFEPQLVGKSIAASESSITSYFGCCANVGLGAQLARAANSGIRKLAGDKLGTLLALLKTLYSYQPVEFTICRDKQEEKLAKLYNLSVGKTFYIASGIKVNHQLTDEDKRLYNLIIQHVSLTRLPQILSTLYSGSEIENNDLVKLEYSKSIEIYGTSQHPEVECDGDPVGYLPCKIEQAADKLELICE